MTNREAFDAWLIRIKAKELCAMSGGHINPDACIGIVKALWLPNGQHSPRAAEDFLVWEAARAEAVIELPAPVAEPDEPEEAMDDSYLDAYNAANRMRDGCVKAIKAAGFGVKP